MPPFNRVDAALAVLEVARDRWQARDAMNAMTLDEARALHDEICVLDLHADTAKLMDKLGYDLARAPRAAAAARSRTCSATSTCRGMRDGGVAGQFFSFWTAPLPGARLRARGASRSSTRSTRAMAKHPERAARGRAPAPTCAPRRRAARSRRSAASRAARRSRASSSAIEAFSRRGVRYLGLLHFSKNAIGRPAKGRGADPTRGAHRVRPRRRARVRALRRDRRSRAHQPARLLRRARARDAAADGLAHRRARRARALAQHRRRADPRGRRQAAAASASSSRGGSSARRRSSRSSTTCCT